MNCFCHIYPIVALNLNNLNALLKRVFFLFYKRRSFYLSNAKNDNLKSDIYRNNGLFRISPLIGKSFTIKNRNDFSCQPYIISKYESSSIFTIPSFDHFFWLYQTVVIKNFKELMNLYWLKKCMIVLHNFDDAWMICGYNLMLVPLLVFFWNQ